MASIPGIANYYYIDVPLLRMLCTPYVPEDLLWDFPCVLSNREAALMLSELSTWTDRVLVACCLPAQRWRSRTAVDIPLREGDLCFLEESMRTKRIGWWGNRDNKFGTMYKRTDSNHLNLCIDPRWVTGTGACAAMGRGHIDVAGLFLVRGSSDRAVRSEVQGRPVVLGLPVPKRNLLGATFDATPICRLVAAERVD